MLCLRLRLPILVFIRICYGTLKQLHKNAQELIYSTLEEEDALIGGPGIITKKIYLNEIKGRPNEFIQEETIPEPSRRSPPISFKIVRFSIKPNLVITC